MRIGTLWLGAVFLVSGCGGPKPPAEEPDQNRAELEALKERVRDLEATSRSQERTATTRFDALAVKLEEIQMQLDEVESLARTKAQPVVKGTPPPRPPPRIARPDPNIVYSVPIKDAYYDGNRYAPVTLVVALEYTEPFSKKLMPTIDQLRNHYGKKLKVVYQNFIVHKAIGRPPALAVCAAGELGRHRDMVDAVWVEWANYRQGNPTAIDEQAMMMLADGLGLSRRKFRNHYDKTCPKIIDREQDWFSGLGVRGVPASFINGRYLSGARSFASFETLIDTELAKAEKAIKKGVKLKRYYRNLVRRGDKGTNP